MEMQMQTTRIKFPCRCEFDVTLSGDGRVRVKMFSSYQDWQSCRSCNVELIETVVGCSLKRSGALTFVERLPKAEVTS